MSVTEKQFENILVEQKDRVAVITLNRPKALNALSSAMEKEVVEAVEALDGEPGVGCIVITGSEKAFAAGADIKEMKDKTYPGIYLERFFHDWKRLTTARTPIIAAVSGFALGGGCELAMMCDMIIAGDNAKFGQPEITLGVIPGMGGSQRLTRAVGKAKAMDLCLTGRQMDAEEAERSGLVARVVPAAELLDEAMKVADKIASMSKTTAIVAKQAVNRSFETTLEEGLLAEQNAFYALFATEDQTEGMSAFAEKRRPEWRR
ncbi:enoyl-CoA hydratase [Dietzia sp. ANT_WB102]|uniref:enoyl-CoA hydratase n=1 Tax=Dietzia sp. ANT_WB102 TaxID=2597345 RepID=UPI0011EC0BEE|nr:enoyl-CoA hydratase [Dietzia sp. ANT_WB102]KAA0916426.1 enoyl-CoA hydratase [Dietzia sp. ANT_WB102]